MEYTFTTVEEQITRSVIETLLNAFPDYNLTVEDYDGDIITERPTRDVETLFDACRAVDCATVFVNKDGGQPWVRLVNGNREDVLSDYTVNLETVLAGLLNAITAKFG